MKYFTIDAENNITLHGSRKEARDSGAKVFSTEEQFADAIGNDNQRLLDIWNSLPGVKPVTKFANRKTATERIEVCKRAICRVFNPDLSGRLSGN